MKELPFLLSDFCIMKESLQGNFMMPFWEGCASTKKKLLH